MTQRAEESPPTRPGGGSRGRAAAAAPDATGTAGLPGLPAPAPRTAPGAHSGTGRSRMRRDLLSGPPGCKNNSSSEHKVYENSYIFALQGK